MKPPASAISHSWLELDQATSDRQACTDVAAFARAVEDLSATGIAKSVDLIGAIELPLPTTRLRSAS